MFSMDTNNEQTIQKLYNKLIETVFLCFLYIQTMCKLYKMHTNVNRIVYAAADQGFMELIPHTGIRCEKLNP